MRRILSCWLLLLTTALPAALAIPARPRYDPPPLPVTPPAYPDLRGTRWFGKTYEKADMTLVFEPDGRLTWSHTNSSYTTGSWKQEGHSVYLEMNNKYCEFKGTVSYDMIQGGWWNVTGLRWPNPLQRLPLSK